LFAGIPVLGVVENMANVVLPIKSLSDSASASGGKKTAVWRDQQGADVSEDIMARYINL
jgi:Mrp family chromosome partitioning ATPase